MTNDPIIAAIDEAIGRLRPVMTVISPCAVAQVAAHQLQFASAEADVILLELEAIATRRLNEIVRGHNMEPGEPKTENRARNL